MPAAGGIPRRLWSTAGLIGVALVAACGGGEIGTAETDPPAETTSGASIASVAEVTTTTASPGIQVLERWSAEDGTDPPDFEQAFEGTLELVGCTRMLPGLFRFGLDTGPDPVPGEGWLALAVDGQDVGGYGLVAVRIGTAGRAAIEIEVPLRPDVQLGPARCSVRSSTDLGSLESTDSTEPLGYEAEAGTVQSLGIGATMAEPDDPRVPWAQWFVGSGVTPVEQVVLVSEDLDGSAVRAVRTMIDDNGCIRFSVTVANASIEHALNCVPWLDPVASAGETTIAGYDATLRESSQGEWSVVAFSGPGETVVVRGSSREVVAALAAAARVMPSTNVANLDSALVGDTPEESARSALAADGYELRTIIETAHGLEALATGPIERRATTDPHANLRTYRIEPIGGHWITSYAGGGGWDQCLSVDIVEPHGDDGDASGFAVVVAGERFWKIEVEDESGWAQVATTEGVAFVEFGDLDLENFDILSIRVVDDAGEPVDCATHRPTSQDGVTDSTWVGGDGPGTTDISTP